MSERAPAPGALAFIANLVNTLDVAKGVDLLDSADGRAAYGLTRSELPAARELRESLRAACLAHCGHRPHAEVTPLSTLLAGAPLVVMVDATDGAATLTPASVACPVPLVRRVAAAIAEAVVAGTWTRLKACQADDCLWAFYDRSPGGRGRWCSMAGCGSRAKMRAYRARRA